MKVIAIDLGFDNVALRNPGDVFDMPDDVFELRGRKTPEGVIVEGQFYEPPAWFVPVDEDVKAKVEADRKAIRKMNESATPVVAAVNVAKQLADYEKSLRDLIAEVAALKAGKK